MSGQSNVVDSLCILSPAKINLGLSIVARRPDGYHEIRTIYQKISLYDEITITRTGSGGGISVAVDDLSVPTDMSNLAAKAAALLLEEFGIRSGLSIRITKRIPAGAGLGGGSSNAAATLHGVNTLFNLNLTEHDLVQRSVKLGADVPFFVIQASTASASGIGEQLTSIPLRVPFWTLIVFPNIHISTAWAYATYSTYNSLTKKEKNISNIVSFETLNEILGNLVNDFERVVFPAYPRIQKIRDHLLDVGALGALLSGSGSSVFGIFDSYAACVRAYESFSREADSRLFIAQALQHP